MIYSLVISLVLTLIIELIISIILGVRNKKDIKVIICANICTNPVVVYITSCIMLLSNITAYYASVIVLEILVVIIEWLIYKKYLNFKKISPFLISFINNVISFGIGIIISFIK